ncbi:MAG: hypothetical protein BHW21_08430 [Eubacterium sp. 45_250]|nr:MAG: hypothetical protein BHW21_08430 [Eubacterium sp. 45_250]
MKSFAKWTGIVVLFLISVGMLTLPLCDLWFAKSRDFEYRTYVLCSGLVKKWSSILNKQKRCE